MYRWLTGLITATLVVQFVSESAAQTPAPSASSPPATAVPGTTPPVAPPPVPVAPGGKPPISISQVPPNGAPIALEAGKGTLLRLNAAAATVFIANPDIADVQVK